MLRMARATTLVMMAVLVLPWGSGARAAAETRPLDIGPTAWFTARTDEALPPALVSEFPPEIVCILVPESCTTEFQEATQPAEDAVSGTDVPAGPVQPVAPATVPVGLLGGTLRYASLMRFDIPDPPSEPFVETFDLILSEDVITYAVESPAFRESVRAAVAQAPFLTALGEDPSSAEPQTHAFMRLFNQIASGDAPLLEPEPTGIEVCAVAADWEAGENLPASQLPELDCAFGANGRRAEDGTWTFDLSLAVQAWLDGTIRNNGIYIGPVSAANLEYGDPDLSANFQVSLAAAQDSAADPPVARVEYSSVEPAPTSADTSTFAPASIGPAPPPVPAGPVAAPPPTQAQPAQTEPASAQEPFFPARFWLLIPLGLAVAVLFSNALEPAASAAGRAGALTRLTQTGSAA